MKKNLPRNAAGKTFGEHLCDKLGYDIVLQNKGRGLRAYVQLRVVKA